MYIYIYIRYNWQPLKLGFRELQRSLTLVLLVADFDKTTS